MYFIPVHSLKKNNYTIIYESVPSLDCTRITPGCVYKFQQSTGRLTEASVNERKGFFR